MKQRLKQLILTSAAALLLGACSASSTEDAKTSDIKHIGILQYMDHDSLQAASDGFVAGLEEAGYVDGENIKIDYQNAQGDQANLQTISEQLVAESSLVLAIATPAAQSLATVSTNVPVVFTAVTDPLSADLVESLDVPGALLTGTSDQAPIDKQVALLGQAVPTAKTVGILYTTSERNSEVQVEEAEQLLKTAGYKVVKKGISTTNDVQDATSSLMKEADVVFVPTDNTVASTMTMIGELSVANKVPVIGGSTDMVDAGGLLTYGTDYESLGHQTAQMAIDILEGADPASMAVQYPETVDLHVNEAVAKKLGIDTSKLTVE